jgi:hypothetical protein
VFNLKFCGIAYVSKGTPTTLGKYFTIRGNSIARKCYVIIYYTETVALKDFNHLTVNNVAYGGHGDKYYGIIVTPHAVALGGNVRDG